MATSAPSEVTIRTYDVGFGDCFLLSFKYPKHSRHVLIDFGSMSLPDGKTGTGSYMERIAKQIAIDCGGKLDAVIATHRHRDHVSGFAMSGTGANPKGPGAIIRGLKPSVVVQPWTEDPRAAKDADSPTAAVDSRGTNLTALYMSSLERMHEVAAVAAASAESFRGEAFAALRRELAVVGADNIKNPSAVENLRTMAKNRYVHYGSKSGLERILPGAKIRVLGPPTLEQTRTILKQRDEDEDEFWHLNAAFWSRQSLTLASRAAQPPSRRGRGARTSSLFPHHLAKRVPWSARWYRYYALRERADSMLSFVRILDAAMNNTSIILLLQIRKTLLLFPGDAQYENWMYALGQKGVLDTLAKVNVYKVGHHGSLNATPKTLWKAFKQRGGASKKGRLITFLSTKEGPHGHRESNTEVPRRTLVKELQRDSNLIDTQQYPSTDLVSVRTIKL